MYGGKVIVVGVGRDMHGIFSWQGKLHSRVGVGVDQTSRATPKLLSALVLKFSELCVVLLLALKGSFEAVEVAEAGDNVVGMGEDDVESRAVETAVLFNDVEARLEVIDELESKLLVE